MMILGKSYNVRIEEDESFRFIKSGLVQDPLSPFQEEEDEDDMDADINKTNDRSMCFRHDAVDSKANKSENIQVGDNLLEPNKLVLQSEMVNNTGVEKFNEAASKEGANGSILNHKTADFDAVSSSQGRSNNVEEDEKSLDDSIFNQSLNRAANPLDEASTTVIMETQDIIGPVIKNLVTAENNVDAPDAILKEINRSQFEVSEENSAPIRSAVKSLQGKKKRKDINDILGFSKVKPVKDGGKKKNKGVALRSAIAAAALSASISSEGIHNRNQILLNEAQAIWAINKIHGIGYDGDEHEVISKIANLEAQDKGRAQCHL